MCRSRALIILLAHLSLVLGGCAAQRERTTRPATAPATPPGVRPNALLSLEEIEPRPQLASATQPSTAPSERAPLEALVLYAQAVDALQSGRRFTAINLLEKALAIDPQSFQLHHALGRAHVIGRTHDEHSIAALKRAAEIQPDHLDLQASLGRQYLARGEDDKALHHLRLARQTSGYRADESGAAAVDLLLGRALQERGYDRAALEQYASLFRRIQSRSLSLSRDPHLAFLISDQLYIDIGDLYARNGQFEDALAAFEAVPRRDPTNIELEARIVRALVGLKRFDEASRRAADAVLRFRASKVSLKLLQEVHRARGESAAGAVRELVRLHEQHPGDAAILWALIELLRENGRWAQAEGLLAAHVERSAHDVEALRRWVHLRLQREDPEGAARLLIETVAARPDLAAQTRGLWADLITPARAVRLRLAQLQSLPVFPWQESAKALAVATVARELHRQPIAEQALEAAVRVSPEAPAPFAPAFRERLAQIWQRRGTDEAEKLRLTDSLIASASADAVLADELRGLSLLYRKQEKDAAEALGKAVELGGESPSLQLAYAVALRAAGQTEKSDQLLWKLISDWPSFEEAYSTLYANVSQAGSESQAERVLNTWLTAMPHSAAPRLLHAARHFRAGRTDAAQQVVANVLEDHGDDPGVLRTAFALYSRIGRLDSLIATLQEQLASRPGNIAAAAMLAEMFRNSGRAEEAMPWIEAVRAALADDPDHLYQVAHLYVRAGRQEASEDVLRRVLQLDPNHPPASNDLGYTLAERGEQLGLAESLIRQAVNAEPENPSYLDSLGWVLYKRGRIAEARVNLEKSIADGSNADPVVLDHFGDLLYRLGDRDAAARQWEQAGAKLAEVSSDREDLKKLKASLDTKTRQLKAGEPVSVSPIIDETKQAKVNN